MSDPEEQALKDDAYTEYVFAGKSEQMEKVKGLITEKKFIPSEVLDQEITWFYEYGVSLALFCFFLLLVLASISS